MESQGRLLRGNVFELRSEGQMCRSKPGKEASKEDVQQPCGKREHGEGAAKALRRTGCGWRTGWRERWGQNWWARAKPLGLCWLVSRGRSFVFIQRSKGKN